MLLLLGEEVCLGQVVRQRRFRDVDLNGWFNGRISKSELHSLSVNEGIIVNTYGHSLPMVMI